jgi:hypothetical protein
MSPYIFRPGTLPGPLSEDQLRRLSSERLLFSSGPRFGRLAKKILSAAETLIKIEI